MSRGLSTPNLAILGCGDLAARIEGSPPAFAHTNIQELSQTRLSPFLPVGLCGITLLVIGLRAEHAFTVEFRNSEAIRVFDFAPSLHGVHRFDSAAMKFEDWDEGSAQFLGYSTCSMRVSLPTPQIKSPHEDLIRWLSVGPHCIFLL